MRTSPLFAVLLLGALGASAQTTDLNTWLGQLQSSDPATRQAGFYAIAKAQLAPTNDTVKTALIALLSLEETYATQATNTNVLNTEGYGNYFSDVVTTVAALRDTRSIDALLGVVSTGGAVGDALASFGPTALDKVIATTTSAQLLDRFFAVLVLGKMLNTGTISDTPSLTKIRSTLNTAALDPDSNTGLAALQGLLKLFHVTTPGSSPTKIAIDIKPGGYPNAVNPRENGVLPVAILSSPTFDATTIDIATVRFGPGQAAPANGGHIEDVNGDGLPDMVFQFPMPATQIDCGDVASFLFGETRAGQVIVGADAIMTVGCK